MSAEEEGNGRMQVRPRCFPEFFESGLELAGAHVRESEPNDMLATADDVPLPLPTYLEGRTRVGDLDWFRVVNTGTITARFVVDLTTLTSTLAGDYVECHDLAISRHDAVGAGQELSTSLPGQRCPSLVYELPVGATNYLLVHTSTHAAVAPGDYLINLLPR